MQNSQSTVKNPQRRRGAIMIVAMVALMLSSVLLASLIKCGVEQRKQLRFEQHRLQAEWMAESALSRALDRLKTDPGYRGEDWRIPPDELDGLHSGIVTITVKGADEKPRTQIVSVEAVYPAGEPRFARRTRQVTVESGSETEK